PPPVPPVPAVGPVPPAPPVPEAPAFPPAPAAPPIAPAPPLTGAPMPLPSSPPPAASTSDTARNLDKRFMMVCLRQATRKYAERPIPRPSPADAQAPRHVILRHVRGRPVSTSSPGVVAEAPRSYLRSRARAPARDALHALLQGFVEE